jgi:hypothetical protein
MKSMFRKRASLASDDEIKAKEKIWNVIRGAEVYLNAATLLQKKAMAIVGHRSIPAVKELKVFKTLSEIFNVIQNDESALNDLNIRRQIKALADGMTIERGAVLRMPIRNNILRYVPERWSGYSRILDVTASRDTFLYDFEGIIFAKAVRYGYYEDTSFANYVYQNILHSLKIASVNELEGDHRWQARLASILRLFHFNDFYAKLVFYEDSIRYDGVWIDTSFVPKYDVREI